MIKKILKIIGGLLGVALLVGTVFVINTIYFRPFSVGVFYEKVFFEFALDSPELLSSLRILEQIEYGLGSHLKRVLLLNDVVNRHRIVEAHVDAGSFGLVVLGYEHAGARWQRTARLQLTLAFKSQLRLVGS